MKNIWLEIASEYSDKIKEYEEMSKKMVGSIIESNHLNWMKKEKAYCLSRAFQPLMEI